MKPVKTTDFGRYVLLRRIAVGGMAEIYRAIAFGSEGFRKPVAIKRLLPFLSENSEYVEMFIREARLAAMLNHANIVQLYDFGRIDGLLYISMEYVHGKDLAELIDRVREESYTVPAELACHLLIQVLEGLRYAHTTHSDTSGKAGLIHRDVTPPNIMISFAGEVKIADFGIAKFPREKTSEGTTLKGKLSYMSPEQASGMPLDHRSDLFSLAICIIELLTLRHVFEGKNDFDVLNRIREVDFTPPRVINPAIPERLEAILLKALQGDPEKRYQNADEFYAAVESFMIEMNYRYSATWLANYMKDLFKDDLEVEREELKAEGELAETLRPGDADKEVQPEPEPVHPRSLDAEPYEDMPTQTGQLSEIRGATFDDLVKSLDRSLYDEETDHEAATIPVMYEKAMRPGEKTFGDVTAVRKQEEIQDSADAGDEIKTVPLSARPELALDADPPQTQQGDEIMTMPLGKKPEIPERPKVQVSEFDETQLAEREPRGFLLRHWFAFVFVILAAALGGLLYHLYQQKEADSAGAGTFDGGAGQDAGPDAAAAVPAPEEPDAGSVVDAKDAGLDAGGGDDGGDDGGDPGVDAGPADQKKAQVKKGKKRRYNRKRRRKRRRRRTRKKRKRRKRKTRRTKKSTK